MISSIGYGRQLYTNYGSDNNVGKKGLAENAGKAARRYPLGGEDGLTAAIAIEESSGDPLAGTVPGYPLGGEDGLTQTVANETWIAEHPAPLSQSSVYKEKCTKILEGLRQQLEPLEKQINLLQKTGATNATIDALRTQIYNLEGTGQGIKLDNTKELMYLAYVLRARPVDSDVQDYYSVVIDSDKFLSEAEDALTELDKVTTLPATQTASQTSDAVDALTIATEESPGDSLAGTAPGYSLGGEDGLTQTVVNENWIAEHPAPSPTYSLEDGY